jgi:DNA repair protein RecO (recombination protein O)
MNRFDTEAIVLSSWDCGESDRVVALYTETNGSIRAIAKGARNSRKRFAHTFEPGSLVTLSCIDRGSLVRLDACKLIEPYLSLRIDVERWGYSGLVSEIVLEMVPEREPQRDLFHLLRETQAHLSEDRDPVNVVLLFMLRFQDIMGYMPGLDGCAVCRRPLRDSMRWYWRINQGQLLCVEHRPPGDDFLALDLGTLLLIHQCRKLPPDRIWRLRISRDRKTPLLHAMLNWIRAQIRKDLKSLKLLQQIRSAQQKATQREHLGMDGSV